MVRFVFPVFAQPGLAKLSFKDYFALPWDAPCMKPHLKVIIFQTNAADPPRKSHLPVLQNSVEYKV